MRVSPLAILFLSWMFLVSPALAQDDPRLRIESISERIAARSSGSDPVASAALAEHDAARASSPDARPLGSSASSDATGQRLLTQSRSGNTLDQGNGWIMSTLVALGAVIGLILALKFLYGKIGGKTYTTPSSPVIEVLSRTAIAPRNHVLMLRVGQRILIVSDSGQGSRTLADITDPDEVADLLTAVTASRSTSVTQGFNQLLNRFGRDYEPAEEGTDHGEASMDASREAVSGVLTRIKLLSERGGAG